VAKTVGTGIVPTEYVDVYVILSCLVGAIAWNVLTWYWGLPSSSSHALMGGFLGAGMMKAWPVVVSQGPGALIGDKVPKTLLFIILSPTMGMIIGLILMTLATALVGRLHPGPVTRWSRRLQLVSSALYSLGHGSNDAQKTAGMIAVLLVTMQSQVPELHNAPAWLMPPKDLSHVPLVIVFAAYTAIALGTLSGGWRIVKTMGMRITELTPLGGVCAETAGAITLFGATHLGIPVSTTHTITGSIVGVGTSRRLSAVRWGVAGNIIWAWILTIPAAGILAALSYVIVGMVWPRLPLIGQSILGIAVAVALAYSLIAWLKTAKSGKPAHA
jgi:PiT family inorganic phosphate transporter